MPGGTIKINRTLEIPESELTFRFSRSSGPGGQNVNRRATRAELVFDVASSPSLGPRQRARLMRKLGSRIDSEGKLHVVAQDERSQARNRDAAVERFAELLSQALRVKKARRPTKPSAAARERRLTDKKARSRRKRERAWKPEV